MIEMKKFLLFIVEGLNDKKEIEAIIHAFCMKALDEKKYSIQFVPQKDDITCNLKPNEDNIVGKIEKIILNFRNGGIPFQRIKASDIAAVIHVVDTDGVFIPNENVIEADVGKFTYYDETIECYNRNQGIQRNALKAKALNKLITQKQIGGIPYYIYYASCNMDHLLYGQRNPLPPKKNAFAFNFASKCSRPGTKYSDIIPDEFIAEGDYDKTWVFIRQGTNSLTRLTNLDLFFRNYLGITPGKE